MVTLQELIQLTPVYGLPCIQGVVPLSMLKEDIVGVYAIRWYRDYWYVGESKNVKARFIDHLTCALGSKTSKMSELYANMRIKLLRGSIFELEVLEINTEPITIDKWERLDIEGEWIKRLRREGYGLYNRTHYLKEEEQLYLS